MGREEVRAWAYPSTGKRNPIWTSVWGREGCEDEYILTSANGGLAGQESRKEGGRRVGMGKEIDGDAGRGGAHGFLEQAQRDPYPTPLWSLRDL